MRGLDKIWFLNWPFPETESSVIEGRNCVLRIHLKQNDKFSLIIKKTDFAHS
jgi:hypothetical protein